MNIKRQLEETLREAVKDGEINLNFDESKMYTLEIMLSSLIVSKGSLNCGENSLGDQVILNFNNINGLIEISRYNNIITEDVIPETAYSASKMLSSDSKVSEVVEAIKEDLVAIEDSLVRVITLAYDNYDASLLQFLYMTGVTFCYPVTENQTPLLRITAVLADDEEGGTVVIFKYATDVVTNMSFKDDGLRGSSLRIKK